jgi:hypothetical protein
MPSFLGCAGVSGLIVIEKRADMIQLVLGRMRLVEQVRHQEAGRAVVDASESLTQQRAQRLFARQDRLVKERAPVRRPAEQSFIGHDVEQAHDRRVGTRLLGDSLDNLEDVAHRGRAASFPEYFEDLKLGRSRLLVARSWQGKWTSMSKLMVPNHGQHHTGFAVAVNGKNRRVGIARGFSDGADLAET